MNKIPLPDRYLLLELLDYNSKSGLLYWKERSIKVSDSQGSANRFNCLFANTEAVSGTTRQGYKQTVIYGIRYYSHRLIWKILTDEEPEEVDHIDGNVINNIPTNLRAVTRSENRKNASLRVYNQSGRVGVAYNERERKWKAYISNEGKRIHLGTFQNKELAIEARRIAEKKYNYHENHGRQKS